MIAKIDLVGWAAFLTVVIAAPGSLYAAYRTWNRDRHAKRALAGQGVNGKNAIEGFVLLSERQDAAMVRMQNEINTLREEVNGCHEREIQILQKVAAALGAPPGALEMPPR